MEIKQGDKVRVSKDAPKLYATGWLHDWYNTDSIVKGIDKEDAVIAPINRPNDELAIPTKYIVKVDAEAKEAKFKVGDRVRVKGYGYEPNLHKGDVGEILDTNDKEQCFVLFKKSQAWIYADCLEPYTEPTEEKKLDGITEETANNLSNVLEGYCNAMQSIADNFDWQKYTADLAKEIALKVANKYNDPKEAAEYAVKVAKAVAEGLKRK